MAKDRTGNSILQSKMMRKGVPERRRFSQDLLHNGLSSRHSFQLFIISNHSILTAKSQKHFYSSNESLCPVALKLTKQSKTRTYKHVLTSASVQQTCWALANMLTQWSYKHGWDGKCWLLKKGLKIYYYMCAKTEKSGGLYHYTHKYFLYAYQYASDGCSLSTFVGRVGSFFKSALVFSSLKKENKRCCESSCRQ